MELTQAYLKTLLDYDPSTGLMTNKIGRYKARQGEVAGTLNRGYVRVGIDWERYLVHRLIFLWMDGEIPPEIDHINGIKDDNRWSNLRAVTTVENHMNMPMQSNCTSGITGVTWDKTRGKWLAYIKTNQRMKNLGRYTTIFDAACARISRQNSLGFSNRHGR